MPAQKAWKMEMDKPKLDKKRLLLFMQEKHERAGYEVIDVIDYSVKDNTIKYKIVLYNLLRNTIVSSPTERTCTYDEYIKFIG